MTPPDADLPRRRDSDRPTPWKVEGGPPADKRRGPMGMPRPPGGRRFIYFVLAVLALNVLFGLQLPNKTNRVNVPYSQFLTQVDRNNVTTVTIQGGQIQGTFKTKIVAQDNSGKLSKHKAETEFSTYQPEQNSNALQDKLHADNVVISGKALDTGRSFLADLLLFFGPTLLLVVIFVIFARRSAGAAGGLSGLGRSRAKRYEAGTGRTTFADVAGIDEAEDELEEVVDFLKNPDKYRKLGAMIPKGVLLSGAPGTGKTLLARAVAGEADVPFFSISASEFIEMVVGVGASRVRDLFTQAKAAAPSIIFIDELDAIGRQRGGGGGLGGHDEREQTLNQILTEMDGFTGSEGVIVLASTNRPDVLDSALLRPGRFDRRVTVNPPDVAGREKILQVHTRSVPLADDVDLKGVASTTPGMVGADLRNLINEAALHAAKEGHDTVDSSDLYNAFEKIVLGTERRITLSHEERERTAYHEGGHALLGMLEPGADPVRKVSIVPRGRALGVTFQSPESDRYGYDTAYLLGRIVGALGGRAAEEIVYGSVTTGAESDLEQVTRIARSMVGRWGMSEEIGLVSVLPQDGEQTFAGSSDSASEATRELVDSEVRRIVEECYVRAVDGLREHRDRLDTLAQKLLVVETLDQDAAYEAAGFVRGQAPGDRPPHGLLKEPATSAPPAELSTTPPASEL